MLIKALLLNLYNNIFILPIDLKKSTCDLYVFRSSLMARHNKWPVYMEQGVHD